MSGLRVLVVNCPIRADSGGCKGDQKRLVEEWQCRWVLSRSPCESGAEADQGGIQTQRTSGERGDDGKELSESRNGSTRRRRRRVWLLRKRMRSGGDQELLRTQQSGDSVFSCISFLGGVINGAITPVNFVYFMCLVSFTIHFWLGPSQLCLFQRH